MRNGILFAALGAIFISIFMVGESLAQSKEFKNPHVRGVRLDLCKHQGGKGCGKPAADLFCKEMSYSRSIGHKVDPRVGERLGRTLVFGDGALCNGLQCRAFTSILCLRDEVVKTPVPEQTMPPKKKKPSSSKKKAEKKPGTKKADKKKDQKKKKKTVEAAPKKPSIPENIPLPSPRPKTEVASDEVAQPLNNFVLILPQARKILPAGATLTYCILNSEDCPYPVTRPTSNDPNGTYQIKHFQWSIGDVPDAKLAVWQLSTKPFPQFAGDTSDMEFDNLVKWSVVGDPKDNRGTITIDFGELTNELGLTTPPEIFYLRVIPVSGLINGRTVGRPSNTILMYYGSKDPSPPEFDWNVFKQVAEEERAKKEAETPKPLFNVRIKSFIQPNFDKGRWGCVVIVEHPTYWTQQFRDAFPVGSEMCPKSYRGDSGKIDSFDDFVDFVFDSWDWVGDRFDDLVDIAVDIVMYATPLGLQCEAAAQLSNESDVRGICETGARVAVNAGMVALGVPPTIPSFNELLDEGVDYAVELAADEFEARTGVPCFSVCEDAFRVGFQKLANELKRQSDRTACVDPTEAHRHGKEPMCLDSNLVVRAAPGAAYEAPAAIVEITRRTDVELPWGIGHPECFIYANMEFENFFSGGTVYGKTANQSIQVNPQTIKGQLYERWTRDVNVTIPQGETITAVAVFQPAIKHQFPWTKELWRTSQIVQRDELGPYGPNWFALFLGSQMTLTAGSNCAQDPAQYQATMQKW